MRSVFILATLLIATASPARQTLNFDAFEATVATQARDGSIEVVVGLSRHTPLFHGVPGQGCFVAPDGLEVTLDGRKMARVFAGGRAYPAKMSGVTIGPPTCAGASWRIMVPAGEAPPTSVVLFALNGGTAQMKIEHLLTPRRIRLAGGGKTVIAGGLVTVEWTPASDTLRRAPRAVTLHVYRPNAFSETVSVEAIDGHAFRFTLPKVPTGPAFVDLQLGEDLFRPRIAACDGLKTCTAGQVTAAPLAVDITGW